MINYWLGNYFSGSRPLQVHIFCFLCGFVWEHIDKKILRVLSAILTKYLLLQYMVGKL